MTVLQIRLVVCQGERTQADRQTDRQAGAHVLLCHLRVHNVCATDKNDEEERRKKAQ